MFHKFELCYSLKLEDLKERLECARENLKSKANELEESQQIIETMQMQIIGLEAELAAFRTGNIDHSECFICH